MNLLRGIEDGELATIRRDVDLEVERLRAEPALALEPGLHPAAFARVFLPHICRRPFCAMHFASFERYAKLAHDGDLITRTGRSMALAAPRGSAKSSIHTLLLPLMDICLQRELYIVIISATAAQAALRLRNIGRELQGNRLLLETFRDALKPSKPWTRTTISVGKVRIDAFGALAEIRGISHGEARPTKIILDDAESSRRAMTPEGRQQVQQWYDEVIENLGDTYTHVEVVGTVLHRRSLLSALQERTGWDAALYKSVVDWSAETELWQNWQRMYADLHDEDREARAETFFRERETQMLAGTRVLWPERETYLDLMKQMAMRGRPAFFKEKQNSPLTADEMSLNPASWQWFRTMADGDLIPVEGRGAAAVRSLPKLGAASDPAKANDEPPIVNWLHDLQIFGFLDPAGGKHLTKGDYAAIVTLGKHATGVIYVLDVWMKRVLPEEQVQAVLALHRKYKYSQFWYEGNAGQDEHYGLLFRQAITSANREPGVPPIRVPASARTQVDSKLDRIIKILTLLQTGNINFSCLLPEEFVMQAEDFPRGKHDDGLDALGSCIQSIAKAALPERAIRSHKRASAHAFDKF